MHHSASYTWNRSKAGERNKMLLQVCINQRTLTLRDFHSLPLDIIVDLNYAASKNTAPPDGFSDKSPPWVGAAAVSGFSLLELLVVCGILAALGGLGLQALDQAPEFAKQHQHLFVSPALHPAALPGIPPLQGAHPISQFPAHQGVDLEYVQ